MFHFNHIINLEKYYVCLKILKLNIKQNYSTQKKLYSNYAKELLYYFFFFLVKQVN